MVREFLIGLYLFLFKIQFNLFKLFPLKNKLTFIVSFKENSLYIYREIKRQNIPCEMVFLCHSSKLNAIKKDVDVPVLPFETFHVKDMVKSIYHLATSKHIIIDNYYGFLASVSFKKGVQCTQLWHAAGAIKKFGLKDQSVPQRSNRAKKRFLKVYDKFSNVIVGSDEMGTIFKEAFNLDDSKILCTGIPRTDLFFDIEYQQRKKKELYSKNHSFIKKKVILYVPTFRDNHLENFDLHLDLDYMYRELNEEFVLLIKLHPAIKNRPEIKKKYEGFAYDFTNYGNVNDLLFITDYLITDYSSIPFEFSLLEKPMLFYPYDLDEYREQRGFWGKYEDLVPGPVVFQTEDLVRELKKDQFDFGRISAYKTKWNKYSQGKSSKQLVDSLFKRNKG